MEDNDGFDRSHIIGKSKALMDVLATIKRIARTNASVLITGEKWYRQGVDSRSGTFEQSP